MNEYDLSVVIPARHEEFLNQTIQDILKNKRGKTQIIVGLDGEWPMTPIETHPDVVVLFVPESIGQRAITNQCVRLSKAKYIMKADAHLAFDEGFDVKMMSLMQDHYTMIPVMRNLHVFDWVCSEGHRRYQGPSGDCQVCGKPTTKDVVWIPKKNPQSTAYRFDKTMHFQYWNEYGKKQQGDLTDSLSIQGSCFMLTREKYWELDICSETFSSWGQQGVEVACKTWLSGGEVKINRTTWYAHMFRTQGGDFGFPYPISMKEVQKNRETSRELFMKDKWEGAKYPFNWLIRKFNPPEWEDTPPSRGILYYTDNALNMKLAKRVRDNLSKQGLPITSVSLKPMDFGRNIHFKGERGYLTMFKQILAGLESMREDIVYFAEHDVLYHPDHFKFIPTDNKFYYNGNYWFLRQSDGFAVHYDVSPLSGLVAYREALIKHFKERVEYIEKLGEDYKPLHIGFEPFTHNRVKWNTWYGFEVFMPENPNIDIAHEGNSTWKRWDKKHFIRQPKFWEESTGYQIPGWGRVEI